MTAIMEYTLWKSFIVCMLDWIAWDQYDPFNVKYILSIDDRIEWILYNTDIDIFHYGQTDKLQSMILNTAEIKHWNEIDVPNKEFIYQFIL